MTVRRWDGSMINFVDPQKKTITIIRVIHRSTLALEETIYDIDENGVARIDLNIGNNEDSFTLKVSLKSVRKNILFEINVDLFLAG